MDKATDILESITLDSSQPPNGSGSDKDKAAAVLESVKSDMLLPHNGVGPPATVLTGSGEYSSSKPVSVKKKKKKRENVALSSIEKLSSNNGRPPVSMSNGQSVGELHVPAVNDIGHSDLKPSQEQPNSTGSTNHRSSKKRNSSQPQQLADPLNIQCQSKHQLPLNPRQSPGHQTAHSTTKNKVCLDFVVS